ncbi:hypothetical protein B0T19DRAFT_437140 [Cercophora scortea]|uniref:N-acetyltransferase domain-containing protein n=1 Tax=Cercophora scortea TaxID=314031 RepID=A0AAE0MLC4_9PEZI|nr:hypothetical protein B0T19DRAFT_437140 [Cercophora scortea]
MAAQQEIRLRLADDGDIDRLIDIHYDCFKQAPFTRYVWRNVANSEMDYKSVMRHYNFRQYFRSESHIIMVAERTTGAGRLVVGYCIWEWATNPDINGGSGIALVQQIRDQQREKEVGFGSITPSWWSVEEIAVDRQFQGLNIARILLGWGLKIADDRNWLVAVMSSPASTGLYEKTGFHYHGGNQPAARREIKVRGESEGCNIFIMKRVPQAGPLVVYYLSTA